MKNKLPDPHDLIKLPVLYQGCRNKALVREKYRRLQKNLCWFCHSSLDKGTPDSFRKLYPITGQELQDIFPPGFMDYPVHLHHDHSSGWTKGAVHNYCNAIMFVYFGS